MISILIGGDVCPMGRVQQAFVTGQAREIFHNLLPDIQSADLAIANLECPLVSRPSPIVKAGPVLGATPDCIKGFADTGWDVLNLANNHSYDHGAAGLSETIAAILKANIDVIGAGDNLAKAQTPVVKQINGQRIVLYAMAEREFSFSDETTPGANPLDMINFIQILRQYKKDGFFITLVHGGREYYPLPSPEMVRRCRFMVDMGADAVICCHTHCPLPWEVYAGRPIIYGLGNLVFEACGTVLPSWHQGYLAHLLINRGEVTFEPIPYIQSLDTLGARAMDDKGAFDFLRELKMRSDDLLNPTVLKSKWTDFCRQKRSTYLSSLFAYNQTMRKLRRFLLPVIHSKSDVLVALLLVQCETHREILETLFKEERTRD